VSILNLQPNTHGGTAKKKKRVHLTENLLGQLRKRKSNRLVNPKPVFASNAVLGP
jgi:hypothetical protein